MELVAIIAFLEQYRYLALFPIAAFEGPIVSFVAGSLIPLGYFNFFLLYITLIFADIIPDVTYYFLGRFGKKKQLVERLGSKVGVTPERFGLLNELWHTHSAKAMMITKFAYGLSTPLLIIAGLVHLPFRRFVLLSALFSMLQYGVLIGLGYFFGSYFTQVSDTLTRVQLIVAAVAVVGVAYYFFTKSMRAQFFKL